MCPFTYQNRLGDVMVRDSGPCLINTKTIKLIYAAASPLKWQHSGVIS